MSKKIISIITALSLIMAMLCFSVNALYDAKVTYGDINNNGRIDTEDARKALLAAAGVEDITDEKAHIRADINNDGYITIFDARQILRGASGVVSLQPSGKFSGFTGYDDGQMRIDSPRSAIAVFNAIANGIKTEKPGFIRTNTVDVVDFHIDRVKLNGFGDGASPEKIEAMVKSLLTKEAKPTEAPPSFKGENCDNAVSVETETFVSSLNPDSNDVYGINCSYDVSQGLMTISIALPDCELDNVNQSSYQNLFNTLMLKESSASIMDKVFGRDIHSEARKYLKNGVATLVFEAATGNVVSYTTSYETNMFIEKSTFGVSSVLTAELLGVEYTTRVSAVYDNFQW